jgi:carbonic anhydrase
MTLDRVYKEPAMNASSRKTLKYSVLLATTGAIFLAGCDGSTSRTHGVEAAESHGADEAHAEVHWGYEDENGPARWGAMQSDWRQCAEGRRQSPIDLASPVEKKLPDIAVHRLSEHAVEVLTQKEVLEELDNGHTVQVNVKLPRALRIDKKSYSLQQFHFHSPSEHTVNGEHLPMEIHFVHEAADGSLAVLGVLVRSGAYNPAIGSLWSSLPEGEGDSNRTQLPESFAQSLLTEAEDGFYHYSGSLTTPPCTEGVKWMIKKVPTELSAGQIERFRAIYDHNNRPTNPLNDRELYVDSTPSFRLFD